jgi:hypothetical protein
MPVPADALMEARAALLDVARTIRPEDLHRRTRNPEWRVGDVLAHVLASDADLISLLRAAGGAPDATAHETKSAHDDEMAAWRTETVDAIIAELRTRSTLWHAMIEDTRAIALGTPQRAWWLEEERPLAEIFRDFLTHDDEHTQDIRLALQLT